MTPPVVSIIVPCYNQACFLPETLDSVLAQTYEDWECIIVDDGSPDNTKQVADEYIQKDNRFKYVHQDNQGLASARNTGIRNSTGEYILPLDSDDIIGSTYVERSVKYLTEHLDTKLVYCKARKFGAVNEDWRLPVYQYESFLVTNCIFCSCCYRKSDFDKTGGYDESMKYGYEDWDFLLSLLQPQDKVYQIDEVLFFYRIKNNSMLAQVPSHMEETLCQIVRNHPELYKSYYDKILYNLRLNEYLDEKIRETRNSIYFKVGLVVLVPLRAWNWLVKRLNR